MSEPPPLPLDPELDALLAAERATAPSSTVLDRVWSRLERSTTAPSGSGSSGGTPGRAFTSLAVTAVTAFALGAGSGIVWAKRGRPPPERIVDVPSSPAAPWLPLPSVAPSPSASPVMATRAPPVSTAPTAPAQMHRAFGDAGAGSSLRAERTLLDEARRALAEDDAPRALALTETHARRFGRPELGEEREAIAIEALVVAGRREEARLRGARFAADSPNSVFLPAVQASLSSIP